LYKKNKFYNFQCTDYELRVPSQMTYQAKKIWKAYIWAGVLCAGFLAAGALYIYGVNAAAVHTLAIEEGRKRITRAQEEVRMLEVERAHMTVGSWLEQRAQEQNLYAAGPVHFVPRQDASVARK